MNGQMMVDPQAYERAMHSEFERTMRRVMEAVNAAPQGSWIEGSEHQVRDLMAEFQQKAYETALQMKIRAAEAAFSPSAGGDAGQAAAVQGRRRAERADDQRPHPSAA